MKENDLNENSYEENENIEDRILSDIPKELGKKMNELTERYGLNVDLRKETWKSFYLKIGKILPDLLKNENDKKTLLDFALFMDENFEAIFIDPDNFDIDFYNEIKEKIELAYERNTDITDQILIVSHKKIAEKYDYKYVIQSLLIFRELEEDIEKFIQKKPLRGHSKESEKMMKKLQEHIEGSEEKKFKMYFFDYILKLGYLIEAYIKEIFIFYLKLCSINDNTKNPDYESIFNQESRNLLNFGKVLNYLDIYDSGMDREISKLRNSIFHSSFMIDYKIDFGERKIIFYDRDRVIEKKLMKLYSRLIIVLKLYIHFILFFPNSGE